MAVNQRSPRAISPASTDFILSAPNYKAIIISPSQGSRNTGERAIAGSQIPFMDSRGELRLPLFFASD
jgi:hypothetical protein